ncbi:MAG: ABC transporter ATP-binding protein [Nitrososphaerales archaeon]|jgi:oligopeptide/dipeptide ABC transporter ATP-binding protein
MGDERPLLEVKDLTVTYRSAVKSIKALDGVSLSVDRSEIIAIVGESGSGKSTLGLSIINLLQKPPAVVDGGEILFQGRDVTKLPEREMASVRGTGVSMIFQDPLSSLDPVYTVGEQISEAIEMRERRTSAWNPGPFARQDPDLRPSGGGVGRVVGVRIPRTDRKRRGPRAHTEEVIEALRRVQIADPERVIDRYPHELSGGMAQRVMITNAMVQRPALLIADEPTSALDVTTQAQVLRLMREMRRDIGSSILLVTHDLAVAAQVADRVVVMYAGEMVEVSEVGRLFEAPLHPYTEGLLNSIPRKYREEGRLDAIPGDVPDLRSPPSGCRFHPRCPHAFERCTKERPVLVEPEPGRLAACFLRYPR